jgi:two-component sensor histidine kinase
MTRKRLWLFLISIAAFFAGSGQAKPVLTKPQQAVLLELAGSYYYVVKYATIDLDSTIIAASHSLGISLLPIMTEAIPEDISSELGNWVGKGNPSEGKSQLPMLKGVAHLQQLYLLGSWYAFQSTSHTNLMDSAIAYLTKARAETDHPETNVWTRRAACLLGKAYLGKNDTISGNAWFRRAIDECHRAGDVQGEATAWKDWGVYFVLLPAVALERIEYFKKAGDLYAVQKNDYPRINTLMHTGFQYFSIARPADAKAAFEASMRLQDSLKWPYAHYTSDVLALMAQTADHYDDMLRYALRAAKGSEMTQDSLCWTSFWLRVADVYATSDAFQNEFMFWMKKVVDRSLQSEANGAVYNQATRLVQPMMENHREKELLSIIDQIRTRYPPVNVIDSMDYYALLFNYSMMKQDRTAEMKHALLYCSAEKRAEATRPFLKGHANYILGTAFFDYGNYKKAEPMFRAYAASPDQLQGTRLLSQVYRNLIHIDTVNGNMVTAVKDYHKFWQLDSSALSVSRARQVAIMKTQYEVDEKQKDIELLQAQTHLQERQLERSALIRAIAIGGVALLLIISALLYNRSRLKQRSNRQLQLQKEEINKQNTQLQRLIDEKDNLLETREWLLKELHHRVKNNLQVMMSLQKLQARTLTSKEALNAITDSNNRLLAMALIHQELYRPDTQGSINMNQYVSNLSHHLTTALCADRQIVVESQLANIELEVSQAIPIGLIMNEAITNAFKHAFKGMPLGSEGTVPRICISLQPAGKDEIQVMIKDNGRGYVDTDQSKRFSLGFSLMGTLTEQLDGNLVFINDNGLTIRLCFPAKYQLLPQIMPLRSET